MNSQRFAIFVLATVPLHLVFAGETDWPLFRGDAFSTGVASSDLPAKLTLLWDYETDKGALDITPAVVDGVAYFGDFHGTLHAVSAPTGKNIWKTKPEPSIGFAGSVAVKNGKVYLGDVGGVFYCLSAKSGKLLWRFDADDSFTASPNFYGGNILIGSESGVFYALTADGKVAWQLDTKKPIQCSPTVIENRGFFAGCDGQLHIVNLRTGDEIGAIELDGPSGSTPAMLGDVAYMGTGKGSVLAINWRTPTTKWKAPGLGQELRSSPAVKDGVVVVGGRDRKLHAYNATNGDELWAFTAKGKIDSSPVIVGDRVFFGSFDGRVYELNLKTGKKVWEYEIGDHLNASPAVANERLLIGSSQGVLYCFGKK